MKRVVCLGCSHHFLRCRPFNVVTLQQKSLTGRTGSSERLKVPPFCILVSICNKCILRLGGLLRKRLTIDMGRWVEDGFFCQKCREHRLYRPLLSLQFYHILPAGSDSYFHPGFGKFHLKKLFVLPVKWRRPVSVLSHSA